MQQPDRPSYALPASEVPLRPNPWETIVPFTSLKQESFKSIAGNMDKLHQRLYEGVGGIATIRFEEGAGVMTEPIDEMRAEVSCTGELKRVYTVASMSQANRSQVKAKISFSPEMLPQPLKGQLEVTAARYVKTFVDRTRSFEIATPRYPKPLFEPGTGGFSLEIDHSLPNLPIMERLDFSGTIDHLSDVPGYTWQVRIGTTSVTKLLVKEAITRGRSEFTVKVGKREPYANYELTMKFLVHNPMQATFVRSNHGAVDLEAYATIGRWFDNRPWQTQSRDKLTKQMLSDYAIYLHSFAMPSVSQIVDGVVATADLCAGKR